MKLSETHLETLPDDAVKKKVKTIPVKIVPNKTFTEAQEVPTKKCDLHFKVAQTEQLTNEHGLNGLVRKQTDPIVFVPLSYLQQLVNQAFINKNTAQRISEPQDQSKVPKPIAVRPAKRKVYEELINDLQVQQMAYQNGTAPDEPSKSQNEKKKALPLIIKNFRNYAEHHQEAIARVDDRLSQNQIYISHFYHWLKQVQVTKNEDLEIICSSNMRNNQTQSERTVEVFKIIFKELMINYLARHAFCDAMKEGDMSQECIEEHRELLLRIYKPREYLVFE